VTVPLVHPGLTASLGRSGFFPSSCTIEAATATSDGFGQEQETWEAVSGLQAIGCAKAPLSAIERQAAGYTATDRVWHVLLKGAYPQIATAHRAVVDGETYDIDAAETDQTGPLTRLRVRQVTT
jgi:hypothetical protein